MLTFKEFISEIISGTSIRGFGKPGEEHDEVHTQLQAHDDGHATLHPDVHKALTHLKDKGNWKKALNSAKSERFNSRKFNKLNVGNTDAGGSRTSAVSGLDKSKVARVSSQTKSESPIVLRTKNKTTGEVNHHLIAGNTRSSLRSNVSAHVIDHEVE